MSGWTDGYVGGIDYIRAFYRDWSPALLSFALTLKGRRPPDALRTGRFAMAEFGCGHGVTTAVLAGANPRARFEAMDFNPSHIAGAQRLAADGGLANAVFREESFAEHARRDRSATEGPDLDVAALHGVWSWVSAENRAILVDVLRRRLRPGGVVFVSYNALPGTLAHMPLRRILVEHCADGGANRAGPLTDRIDEAVAFASRLAALGGGWFAGAEGVPERIESLRRKSPNYIAHEYLNDDWTAFYHADVARELAAAKLDFAGAAVPMEQLDELTLSPAAQAMAAEARDPVYAETLRDILTNRSFRRDLFVKGGERLTPAERSALLRATRFALLVPPDELPEVASTPVGRLPFPRSLHAPLADALAAGPHRLEALLARPDLGAQGEEAVLRALVLLVSLGLASPLPAEDEAEDGRQAHADRFNGAVLERHRGGDSPGHLASPLIGSGLAVSRIEGLFLLAARLGADPADLAWRHLSADGIALGRDGQRFESAEDNRAELARRHAVFATRRRPLLEGLGVR